MRVDDDIEMGGVSEAELRLGMTSTGRTLLMCWVVAPHLTFIRPPVGFQVGRSLPLALERPTRSAFHPPSHLRFDLPVFASTITHSVFTRFLIPVPVPPPAPRPETGNNSSSALTIFDPNHTIVVDNHYLIKCLSSSLASLEPPSRFVHSFFPQYPPPPSLPSAIPRYLLFLRGSLILVSLNHLGND
jgi:hypothetical protein